MTADMNIFAYGTLMIPSVMVAVTGRHFRSQKANLRNYARFTVKGESYPGIIPLTDAITEGIIYFNVNKFSLEQLDIFEGDLYERTHVRVEIEEKEIKTIKTQTEATTRPIQIRHESMINARVWAACSTESDRDTTRVQHRFRVWLLANS